MTWICTPCVAAMINFQNDLFPVLAWQQVKQTLSLQLVDFMTDPDSKSLHDEAKWVAVREIQSLVMWKLELNDGVFSGNSHNGNSAGFNSANCRIKEADCFFLALSCEISLLAVWKLGCSNPGFICVTAWLPELVRPCPLIPGQLLQKMLDWF